MRDTATVYRLNNDYLTEMQPGDVRTVRSGLGAYGGHVIARMRRHMAGHFSATVANDRTRTFESAGRSFATEAEALVWIAAKTDPDAMAELRALLLEADLDPAVHLRGALDTYAHVCVLQWDHDECLEMALQACVENEAAQQRSGR